MTCSWGPSVTATTVVLRMSRATAEAKRVELEAEGWDVRIEEAASGETPRERAAHRGG